MSNANNFPSNITIWDGLWNGVQQNQPNKEHLQLWMPVSALVKVFMLTNFKRDPVLTFHQIHRICLTWPHSWKKSKFNVGANKTNQRLKTKNLPTNHLPWRDHWSNEASNITPTWSTYFIYNKSVLHVQVFLLANFRKDPDMLRNIICFICRTEAELWTWIVQQKQTPTRSTYCRENMSQCFMLRCSCWPTKFQMMMKFLSLQCDEFSKRQPQREALKDDITISVSIWGDLISLFLKSFPVAFQGSSVKTLKVSTKICRKNDLPENNKS